MEKEELNKKCEEYLETRKQSKVDSILISELKPPKEYFFPSILQYELFPDTKNLIVLKNFLDKSYNKWATYLEIMPKTEQEKQNKKKELEKSIKAFIEKYKACWTEWELKTIILEGESLIAEWDNYDINLINKCKTESINRFEILIADTPETRKGLIALYQSYIDLIKDKKIITNEHQFQTNLTDKQRGKLFDLLVKNKFISKDNNKESFIWAFGGEKQPKKFEQIEWIDIHEKQPNNTNMRTLYELLYLLEEGVISPKNAYNYDAINFCFKNLKDIRNKNTYKIMNDTPRKRLLKKIVDQVTEKQKK